VRRLLVKMRTKGDGAVIHGLRGPRSNRRAGRPAVLWAAIAPCRTVRGNMISLSGRQDHHRRGRRHRQRHVRAVRQLGATVMPVGSRCIIDWTDSRRLERPARCAQRSSADTTDEQAVASGLDRVVHRRECHHPRKTPAPPKANAGPHDAALWRRDLDVNLTGRLHRLPGGAANMLKGRAARS